MRWRGEEDTFLDFVYLREKSFCTTVLLANDKHDEFKANYLKDTLWKSFKVFGISQEIKEFLLG